MPLMLEIQESLPQIDGEPSAEQRAFIKDLIAQELPADHATTLHPSVKVDYTPQFSPLIMDAHEQIAKSGKPRVEGEGIDLSRYEEPSEPEESPDVKAWRESLKAAYTSHEYLQERSFNLELLEKYGKNAWLIGNFQLEHELKGLESALAQLREEVAQVSEERRARQENVRGEFEGLEQSWRAGIGRAIETEVAGDQLARQIEIKRRGG